MRRSPLLVGLLAAASLGAAPVDFAHEVVPILRKHCSECHTGDKKKGGFSMNTRASLLEGGENGAVVSLVQAQQSKLLEAVASADPDIRMPPKGDRLSPAEVATLRAWIEQGAVWTDGFAFKQPAYEPPLRDGDAPGMPWGQRGGFRVNAPATVRVALARGANQWDTPASSRFAMSAAARAAATVRAATVG